MGELGAVMRGLTYKPSDITGIDGVRVLRSSNILDNYFVLNNDDVFVSKEAVNIFYVQNGDILITAANGSLKLVGKHALINNISVDSSVPGGFMLLFRANKFPVFINNYLNTKVYSKFIATHIAGGNGSIGNLSKSDLECFQLFRPSDEEINQIERLCILFDSLITLHHRESPIYSSDKGY